MLAILWHIATLPTQRLVLHKIVLRNIEPLRRECKSVQLPHPVVALPHQSFQSIRSYHVFSEICFAFVCLCFCSYGHKIAMNEKATSKWTYRHYLIGTDKAQRVENSREKYEPAPVSDILDVVTAVTTSRFTPVNLKCHPSDFK